MAFFHAGDWGAETRKNPAMKWMEDFTHEFDAGKVLAGDGKEWYTDDVEYVDRNGKQTKGDAAIAALKETYGPLTQYHHEPYYLACTETPYGYEMIGFATVYANLPGTPQEGEPAKVKDNKGKEWDTSTPGAFKFQYRKVGNSFKQQKIDVISDSLPLVMTLVKRGVIQM